MEIPVSNRVILRKKTASTVLELSSGVEMDTDFIFAEIYSVSESNTSKLAVGQVVCVPKAKVFEVPVRSTQAIEYMCFSHEIFYISTKEGATDKSL